MITSVVAGTIAVGATTTAAGPSDENLQVQEENRFTGPSNPAGILPQTQPADRDQPHPAPTDMQPVANGPNIQQAVVNGPTIQQDIEDPGFNKETLVSGGQPMGIQFLGTDDDYNRFLLLQKNGEILIVNATTGNSQTYMDISNIDAGGESGLISITLDPNFEQNGYFYVYYTPGSPNNIRISRFTHQENQGG